MTTQDTRQQRANMLVEIEDVQTEFSGLQQKALTLANGLEEIAKKLRSNVSLKPSTADFSSDFELANRLTPNHQFMLNFAETVKLIEQLKVARQKLFSLAEKKSQLRSGSGGNGFTTKIPLD